MNKVAQILRDCAKEIRHQDILGWGNACEFGAEEIDRLEARILSMQEHFIGKVSGSALSDAGESK